MNTNDPQADQKRRAAEAALALVQPGMVVGLGFGSTAAYATRHLGELLRRGELRDIVGVPCAEGTAELARQLGIPLASLDTVAQIDLTIDGADEVDPQLNLIKGGGGALLREKMVAQASRREVIIADKGKIVSRLGTIWAVPVEVVEFGWVANRRWLAALGATVELRPGSGGAPFHTDQGNLILDCRFGPIADPYALAATLAGRAGIVEHGLFLDLATDLFIADEHQVRHLRRAA